MKQADVLGESTHSGAVTLKPLMPSLLPGDDRHQQAAGQEIAKKHERHFPVVNDEMPIQDSSEMC